MIKPGASEYLLFDSVGITGILVERASWWNGHLARFISRRTFPSNRGIDAEK
ncbi:hypothetical protein [Moorena sp. SIO3A2]|uniref:hypothetical protein n=1 Tax=Moorena sp. SIO3A2 TaxID=2607841 RepID=UPI0013B99E95|nr:hypothetical protein [Moorena sp. SIO3A2]NER91304.1 hypothetical protein [Moorena sp. SIO3A2]